MELSEKAKSLKLGKYKHYKGFICEILGVAKHSEDLSELVVYKHDDFLWVRPLDMFFDEVEYEGKMVKRFEKVD